MFDRCHDCITLQCDATGSGSRNQCYEQVRGNERLLSARKGPCVSGSQSVVDL
jgi:hypothetical protein